MTPNLQSIKKRLRSIASLEAGALEMNDAEIARAVVALATHVEKLEAEVASLREFLQVALRASGVAVDLGDFGGGNLGHGGKENVS